MADPAESAPRVRHSTWRPPSDGPWQASAFGSSLTQSAEGNRRYARNLNPEFDALYADSGRLSIAPEPWLRASRSSLR
jgi:hypothetical protein